ncbi:hypothetical protein GQ54DRAFT_293387 [Martensiomyces pterosporus]|nr:hypothetical protein GQ54DRAFT_293387 [Martensiomyces pterosporus]
MASSVSIVYGPGRSVTIRTTPSTTLQAVLAEACTKIPNAGQPDSYALVYNNKVLDRSLPMRFTALPQGARITLKPANKAAAAAAGSSNRSNTADRATRVARSASGIVKVALQISGGGRIIGDFQPTSTLWDIITTAEQKSNGVLNLSNKYRAVEAADKPGLLQSLFSGLGRNAIDSSSSSAPLSDSGSDTDAQTPVVYQQPVLVLLNREFSSSETMQNTTLASLGFSSGSLMVRLSFRDSGSTTMGSPRQIQGVASPAVSSPRVPPNVNSAAQQTHETQPTQPSTADAAATTVRKQREPEPEADSSLSPSSPDSALISGRQVHVYDVPAQASVSLSSRFAMPDSFYELGASELSALVGAQRRRQAEAEKGFKLRSVQEESERKRIAQYKLKHPKTMIRFRFPDLVQVQATFLTLDSVSELYSFLSSVVVDPSVVQALVLQPPVQDLKGSVDKTLYDAKLTPAAVVHVRLRSNNAPTMELLKPHVRGLVEAPDVPTSFADVPVEPHQEAAPHSGESPVLSQGSRDNASASPAPAGESSKRAAGSSSGGKMPKWFLAGQKRR